MTKPVRPAMAPGPIWANDEMLIFNEGNTRRLWDNEPARKDLADWLARHGLDAAWIPVNVTLIRDVENHRVTSTAYFESTQDPDHPFNEFALCVQLDQEPEPWPASVIAETTYLPPERDMVSKIDTGVVSPTHAERMIMVRGLPLRHVKHTR